MIELAAGKGSVQCLSEYSPIHERKYDGRSRLRSNHDDAGKPRRHAAVWLPHPAAVAKAMFARFDLEANYYDVRYVSGVHGLVSAGKELLVVPQNIIDEIKRRGVNGTVHLHDKPLGKGEPVRIVEGPFRGLEATFERYLSGPRFFCIASRPAVFGFSCRSQL
jgi:hypothetical protein